MVSASAVENSGNCRAMRLSVPLGAALIFLTAAPSFAGPDSARQAFAHSLAIAHVAERRCDLPDEVERVQRWINRFRSGFDTMQNREDAARVLAVLARVDATLRAIGPHAWCVEYRANRNFSPYAY
jgi:hypothetical protein